MKRIGGLLAGIAVVLYLSTVSGCSFFSSDSSDTPSSTPTYVIDDHQRQEYQYKWCYSRLDDRLKRNYEWLYAAVKQSVDRESYVDIGGEEQEDIRSFGIAVKLPKPLYTAEEAKRLYLAFTRDNPAFFFIGNTYSYDGVRSGDESYYDTFKLIFTMDAAQRVKRQGEIEAAAAALLRGLPEDADDFQKELYLHDRLMENCRYDEEAIASADPAKTHPYAFTIYGALVKGQAVCEGYSYAMLFLLDRAGVRGTVVTGYDGEGNMHMWNLVTVDDRNYHLDPTWNDRENGYQHVYFNLTTQELLKTHRLDGDNIGVDTCTSITAQYYRRMGYYINSYILEDIAKSAAAQIRLGNQIIEFQFSASTYNNGVFFTRNAEWFSSTVDGLLEGTGLRLGTYTFDTHPTYGTVALIREE